MRAIVVAYDRKNGIGADNDLLWGRDLPADLAHFKQLTMGKTIVMGRKTFESIGRALPGRQNIVVSRTMSDAPEGVQVVPTLEAAYVAATSDVMVIGGGQIYAQAMDDMDEIYATEVDADFPVATVFFPEVNCQDWQEVSRDHREADERNRYSYDFVAYSRTV
ncbi:MAG: dihydrofolate reductase [Candidatus Saccharimonadales bacterium]